jgi:hypothetical protein
MDRGRATCGGQTPTAQPTRLIRGYNRIDAYCSTQLDLRSPRAKTEVLGGSPHLDARPGGGSRVLVKEVLS